MADTRLVYFGFIHDCRITNGARMVAVDPRQSATAAKADEWIEIRPGTDMALALGMMFHLQDCNLMDMTFLEKHIAGWQRLCEFLREKCYTPRWATTVTDIPEATICRLAEELARAKRAVVFGGKGLNQHTNGFQINRAFQMLCLLAGHWARPMTGFMNLNRGLPLHAHAPEGRAPKREPALRKSPTGWIDAMISGRPYPIKAFIATGNPLSTWPGQAKLHEAMHQLDLVVYMELFPHATSYKDQYKHDPALFWDEQMIGAAGIEGLTTERMKASPSRRICGPVAAPGAPEVETLFQEGSMFSGDSRGRRIPTETGKFEIWTETLEKKFLPYGLSPLPEFYSDPDQLTDLRCLEYLASDEKQGVPSPVWGGDAPTVRFVSSMRPYSDRPCTIPSWSAVDHPRHIFTPGGIGSGRLRKCGPNSL